MRRLAPFLSVVIFCAGLFCLAQAPTRAAGWLPLVASGSGGCIYNAATCSWISVVKTNNGGVNPVSSTQGACVNTLTGSIITNLGPSISSVGDRLWLLANYDANAVEAAVDLINPTTSPLLVLHNSPTSFTAAGYQGNGTNFYIDTGFVPSTSGSNYYGAGAGATGSIGIETPTTGLPTGHTYYDIAVQANSSPRTDIQFQTGGIAQVSINQASAGAYSTITNSNGIWIGSRTSSSAYALYLNNSTVFASDTTASSGLAAYSFYLFANNQDGGPQSANYSAHTLGLAWIGGPLTATQVGYLMTMLAAYQSCI